MTGDGGPSAAGYTCAMTNLTFWNTREKRLLPRPLTVARAGPISAFALPLSNVFPNSALIAGPVGRQRLDNDLYRITAGVCEARPRATQPGGRLLRLARKTGLSYP